MRADVLRFRLTPAATSPTFVVSGLLIVYGAVQFPSSSSQQAHTERLPH